MLPTIRSCLPPSAFADLVKTYPGRPPVEAVRGLDLEVQPRRVLRPARPQRRRQDHHLEILEGLLDPTAGEVEVLGLRWGRDDDAIRARIGISLQETRLPDKLTVRETVTLFRSFYRAGRDAGRGLAPRRARGEGAQLRRASSPAARSSGSPSPARWSATRSCSSSTSRRPGSTRSRAGSSGT